MSFNPTLQRTASPSAELERFFGAIFTITVAVLMVLNEVDNGLLKKYVEASRFMLFHFFLVVASESYGWWVRVESNLNPFAGHEDY